ncbi:unnamed protein product [Malus baccata var. baccata]
MGVGEAAEDQQLPLLIGSSSDELNQPLKRTGTLPTAVAHIITGVIGAGVLSLAWSVAQLGWIGGPLLMIVFASVTILSTNLLSDCYRYPKSDSPTRVGSYLEAVKVYLGEKSQTICAIFVQESLYGTGIAYIITAAGSVNVSLISMAIQHPLELASNGSCDDDGHPLRTVSDGKLINYPGTLWSCVAHIITAVIGAGVLSLAWSTAHLGWIGGPVSLLCFAIVTYISSFLISDCYRSPDPITGTRNKSYMDAVKVNLNSRKKTWFCGLLLYFSLFGTDIAYVITTATSMRAIQRSNCYHKEGHEASCEYGTSLYMLLFGLVQIVMSQIPDFHNMEWLSVIAAIMSFTYSFIGLSLGFAKVIENGKIQGSLTGVPTSNVADKLWLTFQALGDIAFAYPYSIIVLEIQDTLKSPPPENQTMKKASMIAIFVTTFFYLCCGCFGYAAFGDDTPGNLLTGFGFYEPYWLIDFANACIVLHLVGGYQIFSQPVFAVAERWSRKKYPSSGFVNNFYSIKVPLLPRFQVNPFRLCFRTVYVVSTTAIAMIFPYFNQVLGVLGALNFWPLAIYFPVEMYFVQKKIGAWTKTWVVLRTFSIACFLVTVVGVIGSVEGLITRLPGRTDNDVKNHWNTKLKKKLSGMGIDPVTHKPFSHLMAEIATTLEPPQAAHLAEAALGFFKDKMLHLLTKKRIDFQLQHINPTPGNSTATYSNSKQEEKDDTIEKIKIGLSRAMQEQPDMLTSNKPWMDTTGASPGNFTGNCSAFPLPMSGFQYGHSTFGNEGDIGSPWSQSLVNNLFFFSV